jgi:hypothetical protein
MSRSRFFGRIKKAKCRNERTSQTVTQLRSVTYDDIGCTAVGQVARQRHLTIDVDSNGRFRRARLPVVAGAAAAATPRFASLPP